VGLLPTLDTGPQMAMARGRIVAVKFAQACLGEHARRPDVVYLRAAQHLIDHMPRW